MDPSTFATIGVVMSVALGTARYAQSRRDGAIQSKAVGKGLSRALYALIAWCLVAGSIIHYTSN